MMTHKEVRLAYKAACIADPTLRERDRAARARDLERAEQARGARALIALAVQAERENDTGPHVELAVHCPGGRARITLPVRVERLSLGARQALVAGLRSLSNDDDASALYVRDVLGNEERVRHTAAWLPDVESPEQYLDRCLERFAGRIVRAGLNGGTP